MISKIVSYYCDTITFKLTLITLKKIKQIWFKYYKTSLETLFSASAIFFPNSLLRVWDKYKTHNDFVEHCEASLL